MISIVQLEPTLDDDLYKRPRSENPGPILVDGEEGHYEIERLIKKAIRIKRGKKTSEYLVRWKDWGLEYGIWYKKSDLQHAKKLIEDYAREAVGWFRRKSKRHKQ